MSIEYTPLQIATIPAQKGITFDLYIFFKEQYLKYVEKDTSLAADKLTKLKVQKIARFYIKKEDEPSYQAFLDDLLTSAIRDEKTDVEKKIDLVEGAAATGVEAMGKEPSSIASYKITQKAAKSLREVIESNPQALKKIYGRVGNELTDVIRHAMNVCALSTKLGKAVGLKEEELDDLGTAALVHDIGIAKLKGEDKMMFAKPRKAFTPQDWQVYKFHADDSVKMLSDKPYVNESIIDLVRHHEENLKGEGPKKKSKLSVSEQVLSLVNCYDKKIVAQKLTAKEAVKELQIEEMGKYDLKMIQTFIKMLEKEGLIEIKKKSA